MNRTLLPLCALLLAGIAVSASAAKTPAPSAGLTDTIDVAAKNSEAAHGLKTGGRTARAVAGDRVGGFDMRRPARTLQGPDSWASYRLKVRPGAPVTLEVEELYGRDTDVRGYSVLVDGKPAYFRTFPGSGAGLVHYFVQVPARSASSLTVRFENRGEAPVSISRLWAFCDFARAFEADRMDVPYYVAPTLWLAWNDPPGDVARVQQIKKSLGSHPNIRPAFTTFVPYAAIDQREVRQRIDYVLKLAEQADMPVQIEFDTWWANTPSGADGKGGFWTDVPYQQVVYNVDHKAFQLSVPNQWSSTPWLTVDNPALNAWKRENLTAAVSYLGRRYRDLQARGLSRLVLAINQDNEPVYWASGNAGLGNNILEADFNPAAVAAAKKDGIVLDPTDGLSFNERLWLFHNLLGYNEMIAATIAHALDRDSSLVSASGAKPSEDLLRHNVFTQAMTDNAAIQYPMLNDAYPLWETAAPASSHVGAEYNRDTPAEQEALQHQIALGRAAGTNAETSNNPNNMRSVRPGYALAQRYITLYNYPLDKIDVATAEIRDVSAPFPPLTYMRVLRDEWFTGEGWKKQTATYQDVQTGQIGNTAAIAAYPSSNERPGVLTYRLDPPAGGWKGLYVELFGRAFNFGKTDPNVNIRVLAGNSADPQSMREFARFHDTGDIDERGRVDLGSVAMGYTGHDPVFVRIEMHAPGLPAEVLSWVAVWHVRFSAAWGFDGPGLPQDYSLRIVRRQNLLVSWRRDAERSIAELSDHLKAHPSAAPKARLAAARAAYDQGRYATAYRLANEGLCVALPAAYYVLTGSPLAPYPVRVFASQPVTATIEAFTPARLVLRLEAERGSVGTDVEVAGLRSGGRYRVSGSGDTWTLAAAKDGPLKAGADGKLRFSASATAPDVPALSALVQGVFRAGTGNRGEFVMNPDSGGQLLLRTNTRTVLMRGQAGEGGEPADFTELQRGDRLTVRTGPGATAVRIEASWENIAGVVADYQPMTARAMPVLHITGHPGALVLDLYAPIHGTPNDAAVRTLPAGTAVVAPGDTVRARIDPKTGRIYEMWVIRSKQTSTTKGENQ